MSDIIFVEMYRFHLSMQHRYQSTHILKNRNILDTILRQITINQCKMSNETNLKKRHIHGFLYPLLKGYNISKSENH